MTAAGTQAPGPQRVVSLVPSTTESVCRLGAAPRLVGCTRYCTEPAAALAGVARVGGTKNPSREAVMRLLPDLVLANAEENRPEDLEWLQHRVPVLVQTPRDVPAAARAVQQLAAALGCADAARPFLARIDAWLHSPPPSRSRPLRVYYAIWKQPWMSVNRDTFVHDVLVRCGATNVCAEQQRRYPEVAPGAAATRGVDLVVLASEPWPFDEEQRREVEASGAFGPARIVCGDGRDFCWHGVRMSDGLERAAALLR